MDEIGADAPPAESPSHALRAGASDAPSKVGRGRVTGEAAARARGAVLRRVAIVCANSGHLPDTLTPAPRRAHGRLMRAWPALFLCVVLGCAADPSDLQPTEALSAFLSALERSTHAPDQRKLAYEWLDLETQRALTERARLASSLGGRPFEPWDMLVPGRVSFASQSITGVRLRARVQGERATIEIPPEQGVIPPPPTQVPMVREAGRWRVALAMGQP